MDAQAGSSNTPLPNPLASNPLATIDLRWQRALKSLHLSKEPLTGTLNDVQGVTQARVKLFGLDPSKSEAFEANITSTGVANGYAPYAATSYR